VQRVLIIDGYVDEPSGLGVPPYLSPYPRMIWGAMREAGVECAYRTIDHWRRDGFRSLPSASHLVLLGGAIVPGKYLRTMPASMNEFSQISQAFRERGGKMSVLTGPVARFLHPSMDVDRVLNRDADSFLHDLFAKGDGEDRWRSQEEWQRWSERGAAMVAEHPDFPDPLIAEIELMRSCVRYVNGGCSFCTETMYGIPRFREEESIVREIAEMDRLGLKNFRLGMISCTFTYKARGVGESETPAPNPEAWKKLLEGIRSHSSPRVLHTDNANPAVMMKNLEETREVLKLLVKHCTPGNVLSMGLESADPHVTKVNRLNTTPDEVREAVRLVNECGKERGENGMPRLLPGINFISGLDGETRATFDHNFRFLKSLLDEGLWIRRINIRQAAAWRREFDSYHPREFRRFKEKVREEIDRPMLERMLPEGTVLRKVFMEMKLGGLSFGRQIGSYPLLVGVPYEVPLNCFVDLTVTGHGPRSLSGIEYPFPINTAPFSAIKALPGIGEKRAARIFRARPLGSVDAVRECLDDPGVAERILPLVEMR
jgi:radical SAM superfamily enzyme with C-terminal helix-hairpin-helix motif